MQVMGQHVLREGLVSILRKPRDNNMFRKVSGLVWPPTHPFSKHLLITRMIQTCSKVMGRAEGGRQGQREEMKMLAGEIVESLLC